MQSPRRGYPVEEGIIDNLPRNAEEYRRWWAEQQPSIPYGECWCGCGKQTKPASATARKQLWFNREPVRYVFRHYNQYTGPEYIEEDRGHDTPCWIWQLLRDKHGYGFAAGWRKGTTSSSLAHRIYYERFIAPIPSGADLDHLCRVPSCINPQHLEPVTHAVNMQRGNPAKLSKDDIREIRLRAASEGFVAAKTARDFGISRRYIYDIINRKVWVDVT